MELNDRIFVSVRSQEVECSDEHEALNFQMKLLDEEPEGTLVEVRVEFSDGDSWWFRSLRIGDTVYCQPDACTRYGQDANAIIRGRGVPFVNEAP